MGNESSREKGESFNRTADEVVDAHNKPIEEWSGVVKICVSRGEGEGRKQRKKKC